MKDEQIVLAQYLSKPDLFYQSKLLSKNFLDPRNRKIFKAMEAMVSDGVEIEPSALLDYVTPHVKASYLEELITPTTANYDYHEKRVIMQSQVTLLRRLGQSIPDWLQGNDLGVTLNLIEEGLHEIMSSRDNRQIVSIQQATMDTTDYIEQRVKDQGLPGISTGLSRLDDYTLGYEEGKYYIIAARPSKGKTAFLLNTAAHAAIRENRTVGIISLESNIRELVVRMVSSEGAVDGRKIRRGILSGLDMSSIIGAMGKLHDSKMFLFDEPNATLAQVKTIARRMVTFHGVEILFIDYVQIIDAQMPRESRHEQIREVSLQMKGLARNLGIPVVVAAQLRRDAEERRPRLSDIADASQLDKDADVAAMIWEDPDGNYWLLLPKVRDGETADIPIQFAKEYVTFRERIPDMER